MIEQALQPPAWQVWGLSIGLILVVTLALYVVGRVIRDLYEEEE